MRTLQKFTTLAALLAATLVGCRAQVPPAAGGKTLTPEQARRVEILIRARTKLPPDYSLTVGPRTHSEVPGFDEIEVFFSQPGSDVKSLPFLISSDAKTLAQFNKYDISADPSLIVSGKGRPFRGGPENAPVQIIAFDDLECPYCARMHAQLFPALTNRYGNQVRITYRDFPISQHPWAMRAAVDTNCLAAQSVPSYWSAVDYIHLHASDFGGSDKSIAKAHEQLDQLAIDEAKKARLDEPKVAACIKAQNETAIKASLQMGESLGVEATPILFINGEKLEGAYPVVDVFRMIDSALVAAGQTPPPPYVAPAPVAKPGN